jgi:hypothetical protein
MTDLLPEIEGFEQTPRFFKDKGVDFVEISFIGSKDTIIQKVKPEHMAKFRDAWNSYCDGTPMALRKGTALTDLAGINEQLAKSLVDRNVHTLEELSVLNDAQCQGLGHGTLTLRRQAQELVAKRWSDSKTRLHNKIAEESSRPAKVEDSASLVAIADLGTKIDQMGANLAQLVSVLTTTLAPKPRGRPPKVKNGPNNPT